MASIFEPGIPADYYLHHMKNTMQWIEDKMRDAQEAAAKDPSLHKRGYDVGIYVEGRWLQQLVAECVAKHQMLMEYQRVANMIVAHDTLTRPILFSDPSKGPKV